MQGPCWNLGIAGAKIALNVIITKVGHLITYFNYVVRNVPLDGNNKNRTCVSNLDLRLL